MIEEKIVDVHRLSHMLIRGVAPRGVQFHQIGRCAEVQAGKGGDPSLYRRAGVVQRDFDSTARELEVLGSRRARRPVGEKGSLPKAGNLGAGQGHVEAALARIEDTDACN